MRPLPVSRRAVLTGGAAALALSGCTAKHDAAAPTQGPDPEHVLLAELVAEKERTIALYQALGAERLRPFQQRHEAHLAELRKRLPATPPTATPTTRSSPPPKVSLTRLRDVERKAAALRPRQLADASPALAQLIASIGACEAAHALALPRSL